MTAAFALHFDQVTKRYVLNGTPVCCCMTPSDARYCSDACRRRAALGLRRFRYRRAAGGAQ